MKSYLLRKFLSRALVHLWSAQRLAIWAQYPYKWGWTRSKMGSTSKWVSISSTQCYLLAFACSLGGASSRQPLASTSSAPKASGNGYHVTASITASRNLTLSHAMVMGSTIHHRNLLLGGICENFTFQRICRSQTLQQARFGFAKGIPGSRSSPHVSI